MSDGASPRGLLLHLLPLAVASGGLPGARACALAAAGWIAGVLPLDLAGRTTLLVLNDLVVLVAA
jgi:hypothetical protein